MKVPGLDGKMVGCWEAFAVDDVDLVDAERNSCCGEFRPDEEDDVEDVEDEVEEGFGVARNPRLIGDGSCVVFCCWVVGRIGDDVGVLVADTVFVVEGLVGVVGDDVAEDLVGVVGDGRFWLSCSCSFSSSSFSFFFVRCSFSVSLTSSADAVASTCFSLFCFCASSSFAFA